MNATDVPFGYLFAHFRRSRGTDVEKIHSSLSRDDSPLRWDPLWGGEPALGVPSDARLVAVDPEDLPVLTEPGAE